MIKWLRNYTTARPHGYRRSEITWLCDRVTMQSRDHVITWLCNHVTMPSRENAITWLSNHVTMRSRENVIMWLCDHATMQSCDNTITWRCDHMTMRSRNYAIMWLCNNMTMWSRDLVITWLDYRSLWLFFLLGLCWFGERRRSSLLVGQLARWFVQPVALLQLLFTWKEFQWKNNHDIFHSADHKISSTSVGPQQVRGAI